RAGMIRVGLIRVAMVRVAMVRAGLVRAGLVRAIFVRASGIAPHGSNFDLAVAGMRGRDLGRLATPFFHVGFDHLRRGPGGEISMLAFFEQRTYNDFRISPWLHAHEPAIVLELLTARTA